MALKLLDGPNSLVWADDGSGCYVYGSHPFWVDEYGLIATVKKSTNVEPWYGIYGAWSVIQPDGTAYPRNNAPNRLDGLFLRYDQLREDLIAHSNWFGVRTTEFDSFICVSTSAALPVGWVFGWTRLRDRWINIRPYTSNFVRYYLVESFGVNQTVADKVTEYTSVAMPSGLNGTAVISPGRDGLLYAFFPTSGHIIAYNPNTKTQIGPWKTLGSSAAGCWYSRKYNCFISYHSTSSTSGEVRWWHNSTEATALSKPIALDPVQKGQISRIQVQVTGAQGEEVSGLLVDWSITSGLGLLEKTQTKTDDNGYAEVRYIAPVTSTGSVTIQASVVT